MKTLTILAAAAALTIGPASLALAHGQAGPTADPNAAHNPAIKSPSDMTTEALAKGHNSFTRSEARARMRKAGYAHITGLMLDGDGLWQAHATHGGAPSNVALDYKGNVASQ